MSRDGCSAVRNGIPWGGSVIATSSGGTVEIKTPNGRVKLRIEGELRGADLSGKELAGVTLANQDLRGTRFSGARLVGVDFSEADLQGAHFDGANLTGAHFEYANLEGANLLGGDLYSASSFAANLEGANLELASLRGADLKGANLRRANLRNTNLGRDNPGGSTQLNAADLRITWPIDTNMRPSLASRSSRVPAVSASKKY